MKTVTPERAAEAADYVLSHWRYDPDTGLVHGRLGKPIGSKATNGALSAMVYLPGGTTSVLLHRAAWLLNTGEWPRLGIDHRDGNRANNRWSNLRIATNAHNRQNLSPRGKSGHLRGCTPYYRKWKAQLVIDGTHHYLGLFDTEKQAHAAYCEAKKRLHPFNPVQRPA